MYKTANSSWLDWVGLIAIELVMLAVFLPWVYGYDRPLHLIPNEYNPNHNGFDSFGIGHPVFWGCLIALALWWVESHTSGWIRALVRLAEVGLGGVMLFLIKIAYSDFHHFWGFSVETGFWITLAALLAWTGLTLARLVGSFRRVSVTILRKAQ